MTLSLDSGIINAKAYVLDKLKRHQMDEEENSRFPTLESITSKAEMDDLFGRRAMERSRSAR